MPLRHRQNKGHLIHFLLPADLRHSSCVRTRHCCWGRAELGCKGLRAAPRPFSTQGTGRSVPTALRMQLGLSTWPQTAGITKRLSGLFHPHPTPLVSQTGPYWCIPCLHLLWRRRAGRGSAAPWGAGWRCAPGLGPAAPHEYPLLGSSL